MKLIVGLGNPGTKYEKTRHNIGFDIIDLLVREFKAPTFREKFQGLLTEINVGGEKILFLKPQTYMNLSGDSLSAVAKFYKIDIDNIMVIYDDMDTNLGKIRFRPKGSSGGHNGIKSIISHMGEVFPRVRFGIGKPTLPSQIGGDIVDFVLSRFTKDDEEKLLEGIEFSLKCVQDFIKGIDNDKLMQRYNRK
ncbi:MAG: aminoacyl-tRNA hydrolase [Cetobacterium sp.]